MKLLSIHNFFLNLIKIITHSKIMIEKSHTNIIVKMLVGKILFFYCSVKMWNEFPNELVSCKILAHFRLKLKKFDLNKIFTSKIF